MKKKGFYKNRIKGFYIKVRNRIKDEEKHPDEIEQEENFENPEEEGDLS